MLSVFAHLPGDNLPAQNFLADDDGDGDGDGDGDDDGDGDGEVMIWFCRQWQDFPCVTDQQCRTWNTGNSCCSDSRWVVNNDNFQMEILDKPARLVITLLLFASDLTKFNSGKQVLRQKWGGDSGIANLRLLRPARDP